jgi:hypothetical protein
MGLYTSFDTSEYYDTPSPKPQSTQNNQETPHTPPLTPGVRKSLYDKAQQVADKKDKLNGIDFRVKYRVGQKVAIQGPNGQFRTKNGSIAEIVAENLMYVYMEDSYKDSTDQWLADFVTDKDTIHIL